MRSVNIFEKITEVLPAEIVLKYPFGELGVTKLQKNEIKYIKNCTNRVILYTLH